jgi:hypothetical protein
MVGWPRTERIFLFQVFQNLKMLHESNPHDKKKGGSSGGLWMQTLVNGVRQASPTLQVGHKQSDKLFACYCAYKRKEILIKYYENFNSCFPTIRCAQLVDALIHWVFTWLLYSY